MLAGWLSAQVKGIVKKGRNKASLKLLGVALASVVVYRGEGST